MVLVPGARGARAVLLFGSVEADTEEVRVETSGGAAAYTRTSEAVRNAYFFVPSFFFNRKRKPHSREVHAHHECSFSSELPRCVLDYVNHKNSLFGLPEHSFLAEYRNCGR